MRELRTAAIAVVVFTVVLGLAYPLAMTGVSQVALPGPRRRLAWSRSTARSSARSSSARTSPGDTGRKDADGNPILVPDPRYFQSRPVGDGLQPVGDVLQQPGPEPEGPRRPSSKGYVDAYLKRERPYTPGLTAARIPPDAVTTSASGVDPQISEANARIQANRVARGARPAAGPRRSR